jgi:hypothetical protein
MSIPLIVAAHSPSARAAAQHFYQTQIRMAWSFAVVDNSERLRRRITVNLISTLGKLALITAALALVSSCATTPPSTPVSEDLLMKAGFKTVIASSPLQQQHLATLQQGTLTEMQRTGKHYYVYPDVPNKRLYVGTPKEYEAYLALRTRNGLPNLPAPNVTTADMQNYLKQDAAMTAADAQAATIPSWAIWPDFGGLGWVP